MERFRRLISRPLIGVVAGVLLAGALTHTADAATIPEAYQYDVTELQQTYPGTRNQGEYDTCWAFSAVGMAEFDLIADDKAADRTIDLSELQLSYYTYHNEEDPFGGTYADLFKSYQNYLKTGGSLLYCTRTLLQWQGLIPESDLPYKDAASLRVLDSSYAFSKDAAHLQNVYILDVEKQQDALKSQIMKHGSAGICFYAEPVPGKYDTKAVYSRTGEMAATYYCPTKKRANHAVNIVGWDDSFPAENFKTRPVGDGAWLVRNSWSDTTGNDYRSYFWLSYYEPSLDSTAWVLDFEPADNYDFNYQYDGCAHAVRKFATPTCANVFRTQGAANEQLSAVSVSMYYDENVPYTIRVYTNLADPARPRSGILAATVSGKTKYAGNYTIPLKKNVSLPKGTYYSVVVELKKSGAGIDVECAGAGDYIYAKPYIEYNQSFLLKDGEWEDLEDYNMSYGTGNLCIKAFTDKSGASIGKTKNLKSAGTTKNSVKLSWSKVSGARGYEIYRSTSKNGTYKKVTTVTKTSYQNTKLASKHTYYYKVRAYKTNGKTRIDGALSAAVKTKTK